MSTEQLDTLTTTLALAVPLEIGRIARLPTGLREHVLTQAPIRAGRILGSHGDALQWPSRGRRSRHAGTTVVDGTPGTAAVFAALATGLAAAAYQPDGVSVFGRHWCTTSPCPHPGGVR